ncbi:MAG: hypothetical protein K6G69_07215 [Lachnospiraceae bacterium]|nr:hypothetical protein [Lachnospiraceae bacterium]
MQDKYFNETLHNFISDAAYGAQIKHLYELGYSASLIKARLDYPVSLDAVKEYLWKYLLDSGRVVYHESDIRPVSDDSSYTIEYDSYGRKTFLKKHAAAKLPITYSETKNAGSVQVLSDSSECLYARVDGMKNEAVMSFASFKSILNDKEIDYLSSFTWPDKPVFIILNENIAAILDKLRLAGKWQGSVIDPVDHRRYVFTDQDN